MVQKVRAHVLISGMVQGVCYRMETRRAAEQYDVTGWVKNKSDGRVEAVFEGEENKVHSVVEWCRRGPSLARVDHMDVDWETYKGEFKNFDILY